MLLCCVHRHQPVSSSHGLSLYVNVLHEYVVRALSVDLVNSIVSTSAGGFLLLKTPCVPFSHAGRKHQFIASHCSEIQFSLRSLGLADRPLELGCMPQPLVS
jgi:hypothetical protein